MVAQHEQTAETPFDVYRDHFEKHLPQEIPDREQCVTMMSAFLVLHESWITIDQLNFCIHSMIRGKDGIVPLDSRERKQLVEEMTRRGYLHFSVSGAEDRFRVSPTVLEDCAELLAKVVGEK